MATSEGASGSSGLIRRDDYMNSHKGLVNTKGQQTYKSYIDENTGNLYPANAEGTATIATHVRGGKRAGAGTKSDSPYTSFSEGSHNDTYFGDKEIFLDVTQLKADIIARKVTDTTVIDHRTMLKIFERRVEIAGNNLNSQKLTGVKKIGAYERELQLAEKDLVNVINAKEVLIKGIVPANYLKIGK
jgi:hypothetical protein